MGTCTAFLGTKKFAAGPLPEVSQAVRDAPQSLMVQVFDDETGVTIDVDRRGPAAEPESRGRGRPRLGVIAREVTLLPRHWDWLGSQPGGASVALRRLVDEARKRSGDRDRVRLAQEAAYRFMSALGGNLPGFEEASRALFRYDRRRFADLIAQWPEDIRDYAIQLAFADLNPAEG